MYVTSCWITKLRCFVWAFGFVVAASFICDLLRNNAMLSSLTT